MSGPWSSLRNRIAIVASAVTLFVLLLVSGLLFAGYQRQLDAAVDVALREEIGDVQRELVVTFGANRRPRTGRGVDPDALQGFVQRSGNNFQLVRTNGEVLLAAGTLSDEVPIVPIDQLFAEDDSGDFRTVEDERGRRFRVVSSQVGRQQALIVGYSLSDVDRASTALRRSLLVVIPLLAALLGMLIWFFVGRALAPVEHMRREVDAISATELDARVTTPEASELNALATTMNSMLERIETSVVKQQQFVSDASHELRSPLTGIRGQLEVNLQHPNAPGRSEADAEILDETIRMQTLVEDLLALARSDQGQQHVPMEILDLDDIVQAEVARQRAGTGILVEARNVSAVQLRANPSQMNRLVRNLVSNAIRHADSVVTVSLIEIAGIATLAVSDDGPGVPETMRESIFERFTRSDDARDRDSGGSGLGLAICRSIADAHGGSIELEPPSRFVVRLPVR